MGDENAKNGTLYEVAKDKIGDGYHVRRIPKYEAAETLFGFADVAAAEAWVTADKTSHRPARNGRSAAAAPGNRGWTSRLVSRWRLWI